MKFRLALAWVVMGGSVVAGQELEARLRALAAAEPGVVELSAVGSSRQGRPLHLVRLTEKGAGSASRPTLVVVAGINGMHRVGPEVAVGLAESLAKEHKELLASVAVCIMPCLNPDTFAWHREPGRVKVDWHRTIRPVDGDRDGRRNEDPAEDLNGDGVISMMRVKDPLPGSGLRAEYCEDPEQSGLMKKPDATKGERARFALLIEGIDNDRDGKFNEDGVGGSGGGGVDLDRNFPYRYPEFEEASGEHALSEPESLALVDWMLAQKNIAAVLVYGPGDTLVNAPLFGRFDATNRVPLGFEEGDKAAYESVSKLFKDITKQTGAPTADRAGTFQGWAYGHYGILSFETPVWVRPDLVKKEEQKKAPDAREGEGKNDEEPPPAEDEAPRDAGSDQARAQIQRFMAATPEEQSRMMSEFQSLPTSVQAQIRAQVMGAAQPAGGAQQPGAGRGRGARGGPPQAPPGEARGAASPPAAAAGSDDAKWLKYDQDRVKAGAESGFLPWKEVEHPQLGRVEVGGFLPGFKLNPPDDQVPRLVEEQAKFAAALAAKFPRVMVQPPLVEPLGGDLWRISVRAVNEGDLPTMTAMGAKARRETPTILTIDASLDRIVSGQKIVRAWVVQGNGGQAEAEWIVRGGAGSEVRVDVRPTVGADVSMQVKLEEKPR